MTYYDYTIRKRITEQLKGYRSMLEQTLISASDQNLIRIYIFLQMRG